MASTYRHGPSLTQVYSPSDEGPVNIIAVHGMNTESPATWQAFRNKCNDKEGYVNWLADKDMLPNLIPSSPIWTFHYDALWLSDAPVERLTNLADKLLLSLDNTLFLNQHTTTSAKKVLFIASSYGGVVVAQAVEHARATGSQLIHILHATIGVIFLGSPLRSGPALTALGRLAVMTSGIFTEQPSQQLEKDLEHNTGVLQQLLQNFGQTANAKEFRLQIRCFYELKKTRKPGFANFIVSEDAACIDGHFQLGLDVNHTMMNKFFGPHDKNYEFVSREICKLVENHVSIFGERSSTRSDEDDRLYRIDFSLRGIPVVGNFVERVAEMTAIEEALLPASDTETHQNVFVLHGHGGMGKTQLLLAFIKKHHRKFSSVFWLDGSTHDSVRRSLVSIAPRLPKGHISERCLRLAQGSAEDPRAVIQEVLDWFERPANQHWLIVFDNVDRDSTINKKDLDAFDITSYMPGADHGTILITSRLSKLQQYGKSHLNKRSHLKVGPVTNEQGKNILASRVERPLQGAESLARLVGNMPLALAQAGSFIEITKTSISDYIKFYKETWRELFPQEEVSPLLDYPNRSVQSTWTLSYRYVQLKNEDAANLLQLWAYFDHQDLWYELFPPVLNHYKIPADHLPDWFKRVICKTTFVKMVEVLLDYSLIEANAETSSYSVHPVVHEWCFHKKQCNQAATAMLAISIIGSAIPRKKQPDFWARGQRLLPHCNRAVQWMADGLNKIPKADTRSPAWFISLFHIGVLFILHGRLERAENVYLQALEGCEKASAYYPDRDRWLRGTNHNLGLVYSSQGRLSQSEEKFLHVLEEEKKSSSPDERFIHRTLVNLARLCKKQGKLDKAEKMYLKVLEEMKKCLSYDDSLRLYITGGLGVVYREQGRLDEAEKLSLQALAGYRKLTFIHRGLYNTAHNLGYIYDTQGKLHEAERWYLQALHGYEKTIPDHTATFNTANNLGCLYDKQGKLDEAERLYLQALHGYEKTISDHKATFSIANNLGRLYDKQGKLDETERLFLQALHGYEKTMPDQENTFYTVNKLGELYAKQGKPDQAEKMFLRALEGKEKALGPNDPSTLRTVHNLKDLYEEQGNWDEAEKMSQILLSRKQVSEDPEPVFKTPRLLQAQSPGRMVPSSLDMAPAAGPSQSQDANHGYSLRSKSNGQQHQQEHRQTRQRKRSAIQ